MATPLSVNAKTNVEVNDSCNCCWFFRKKPKEKHRNTVTVTDEVYHRTITRVEREVSQEEENGKGSQSKVYYLPE